MKKLIDHLLRTLRISHDASIRGRPEDRLLRIVPIGSNASIRGELKDYLLKILRIGHDASIRGEGLSLHRAKRRARYSKWRTHFTAADLVPLIRENPAFIEQWLLFCGDKRTSGGWYVNEWRQVGRMGRPDDAMNFLSVEEAIAEYVVRELDSCPCPPTIAGRVSWRATIA